MPDIIYNEGRVVGFSAYETYLRQHLAELGDSIEPASEREWLASMLAGGSAVLLKIPAGISNAVSHNTGWFYLDTNLPNTSTYMTRLCAANTITAYLFDGHGNYTINSFPRIATSVASFGDLIPNTQSEHLSGSYSSINTVPITAQSIPLDAMKHKAELYAKIIDGVVIQPGTWVANPNAGNGSPAYFLKPDLKKSPGVRLKIAVDSKSEFDEDVEILLIGWTNRSVVAGEVGTDLVNPSPSASGTPSPLDQDFLGPATFPWASKIMFVAPSYAMYWVNERLDEIEDELDVIHDEIDGIPVITTEYQDISVSGTDGIGPNYTSAPNGLLVIHKKTKVPGSDPAQYTTANAYALALNESDRQSMNIDDATKVVNPSPDGYVYWEHLLPALHKKVSGKYGKIDALTSFLRQLNTVLENADDGQYVININNNHVTIDPYVFSDDEISKFKLNLIHLPNPNDALYEDRTYWCRWRLNRGTTNIGNGPLFRDLKLDLFGYVSEYNNGTSDPSYYTHTLNMIATLTMRSYPYTSGGGYTYGITGTADEWYQKFRIDDKKNIMAVLNMVISLHQGNPDNNSASLMFASAGRPMIYNNGGWNGCILGRTDFIAYIDLRPGTHGIVQVMSQFTEVTSISTSDVHIEGILFGYCTGGTYAGSSSHRSGVASCAVTGAVGISDKVASYEASGGTITGTGKKLDGTTGTFTINLTNPNA